MSRSMFHCIDLPFYENCVLYCSIFLGERKKINEIFVAFQDTQLNTYNRSEIETWNLLFVMLNLR